MVLDNFIIFNGAFFDWKNVFIRLFFLFACLSAECTFVFVRTKTKATKEENRRLYLRSYSDRALR